MIDMYLSLFGVSSFIGKEVIHMTLYEAQKDHTYIIEGLYVEEAITRRLQALGLNDGTKIKVLNRTKKGALIIQVRCTRLALGKHICTNIEIREDASMGEEE